jgi:RNA recognition motif-containing protein
MGNDAEAQAAIGALNGSTIVGQVVRVNEARPKPKDSKGTG